MRVCENEGRPRSEFSDGRLNASDSFLIKQPEADDFFQSTQRGQYFRHRLNLDSKDPSSTGPIIENVSVKSRQ